MAEAAECVLLFSGGTDSTLAAALQQERFSKVHLVTYDRFGLASVENTKVNAEMLRNKYGPERFEHHIINIDPLFKFISYEDYFSNLRKHGLLLLSTCGLCKLAMHVRTVQFCIERGIKHVSDGANRGMIMFPDQTQEVIAELAAMYRAFGIEYSNPVFQHAAPAEGSFIKFENLNLLKNISGDAEGTIGAVEAKEPEKTTGWELYKKGLAPLPNVKGTAYDRKRQPRCFQFVLFKIMVNKYYLQTCTFEEYSLKSAAFFKDKITKMTGLLLSGNKKLKKTLKA